MKWTLLLLSASAFAQVPYDRIVNADKDPGNWLTYSGNYSGHRFSPLAQITPSNISGLHVKWARQFETPRTETSPIVVDGVMYITAPNSAYALDARTGRQLWKWSRPIPKDYQSIGFGQVNRGPAILDGTLFVATLDCYLVAIDIKNGAERWTTQVADYKPGYSMTLAPLAIKGKVLIGVAGGEAGIRGFVDAYDSSTGKRSWRFYTIPAPGEPGSETWPADARFKDSWKTGGGSTWVTGSYDPDTNLVYWGVGNPGPDWNADSRAGDNLYTCSLLALDGDTGALKWHFQFTPHDTHDWDSTHVPVLFEGTVRGQKRKLVAIANRNAFFYVLDRSSGEFVTGREYAKQTWAKGLDDKGRPMMLPNTEPTAEGTVMYPNLNGATVWFSPSFSPLLNLFYVSVRELGSIYFKREADYKPGTFFAGGGEAAIPHTERTGAIRALEPLTGKLRWEFPLHSASWAGVLSTAGGLVFSGSDEGNFFALDASTGKPLWNFQTGGPITANPISFTVEGKQHIAIAANRVLYVFGL